MYSVTLTGGPRGACPTPSCNKRPYISETIQISSPKLYIYSLGLGILTVSEIYGLLLHEGVAYIYSCSLCKDIGLVPYYPMTPTVGLCPNPLFIKGPMSQKQFRSSPQNQIYCNLYDKSYSVTQTGGSRGMPHPFPFIKGLITLKPFRTPPLNRIYTQQNNLRAT